MKRKKNRFKDVRHSLYILIALTAFIIVFYCVASLFTSAGYNTFLKARNIDDRITEVIGKNYSPLTIVIDPGHGGEDPGAVANGVIEKEVNLKVAIKLKELLSATGYNIVLTRDSDVLLYNEGEENKKKHYDVRNRLKIVENYENSIYVGIHMNKFPIEKYKGLQTFYSENHPLSKSLAFDVQEHTKLLLTDNTRKIRPENNSIYILNRAQVPAVLVECGFLSNYSEAKQLSREPYQEMLAFTIYCGITEFLSREELS